MSTATRTTGIVITTGLGDLYLNNPVHWRIFRDAMEAAKADQAEPTALPYYINQQLREHFGLFPIARDIVQAIAETIDPETGYSALTLAELAERLNQPEDRVKAIRAALVIIEVLDAHAGIGWAYFRLGHGITDPIAQPMRIDQPALVPD